jgi:ABC-2 type transport system ATP-binding protein
MRSGSAGAVRPPWLCCPRMVAVEFDRVFKRFGSTPALTDVSFQVKQGATVGLLGPNGSGKTTTIRLLLNLFYPDSGKISILESQPSRAISDRIGYLPEERGLYRAMRVDEHLRYYARLKGVRVTEAQLDEWLELLEILPFKRSPVASLSKGTAQKVQFVGTILHDPDVVILDEPFSGLDPLSRTHLRAAISVLIRRGKTILFSTHDMATAEQLCDHFLMLYRGKKVLDGSHAEVRRLHGARTIKVTCEPPLPADSSLVGVLRIVDHGSHQELVLAADGNDQDVLNQVCLRARVGRFELAEPSLQDIFLRLARD